MFSSGLNDEVREIREDAEMVGRKIGDERLLEKIRGYVEMDKEGQDELRADAGTLFGFLFSSIIQSKL